jgi:PilZ domain
MEHRRHPRRQLVRNALLYHPQGYSYPCRIENASPDGLFIRATDARIYKGNCVAVAIDSSPHTTGPLTTKALVVHKKHDGIGLLCEGNIPLHELFETLQQSNGNALEMMARLMRLGNAHWLWLWKYFPKKAL